MGGSYWKVGSRGRPESGRAGNGGKRYYLKGRRRGGEGKSLALQVVEKLGRTGSVTSLGKRELALVDCIRNGKSNALSGKG